MVHVMHWSFRLAWCLRALGSAPFHLSVRASPTWTEPSAAAGWLGDAVAAPALQMPRREICFTGARSRTVLGYDAATQGRVASRAAYWSRYNGRGTPRRYDEGGRRGGGAAGAGTVPGRIPLLSRDEIEEDMRRWADRFWAEMTQPVDATTAPAASSAATKKSDRLVRWRHS